jgi:hypothetical protein
MSAPDGGRGGAAQAQLNRHTALERRSRRDLTQSLSEFDEFIAMAFAPPRETR